MYGNYGFGGFGGGYGGFGGYGGGFGGGYGGGFGGGYGGGFGGYGLLGGLGGSGGLGNLALLGLTGSAGAQITGENAQLQAGVYQYQLNRLKTNIAIQQEQDRAADAFGHTKNLYNKLSQQAGV